MAGERPWRGIRVKVTAIATVGVLAVLVVIGVVLVDRQRSGLAEQLEDGLSKEAGQIAAALAAGADRPVAADDRLLVVERPGGDLEVWVEGEPLGDVDGLAAALSDDPDEIDLDGDRWLLVTARAGAAGGAVVHLGGSLEDVDESVAELRASLLWIVPVATLVLGALVWIVVGRTLRPVERIRTEVASIGGGELDRRVPVPPGGDEIARLAETMNAMLDRLERSAQRQQRFVADAAHELRTPLTRMRAELEVDAHDPGGADHAATRRSQLEEVRRLQALVDDLLLLARSDAGEEAPRSQLVDLDDIVLDEARAAQSAAGGPRVDATGVSAAQVTGDPGQLRRVVRNLVDNACRHAAATVAIELGERDGTAVLTVSDDGSGIPAERAGEVFERFTRLDDARVQEAGGAGLGLAIVKEIVQRHGGTVVVERGAAGGARFTVALPRGAAAINR